MKLNQLIAIVFIISGLISSILIVKTGVEIITEAQKVDEASIVPEGVVINTGNIKKAIENIGKEEIVFDMRKAEEANENDEEKALKQKVEIINGSGISGAAKEASEVLGGYGFEFEMKNSETVLDETTVFYNNGYSDIKNEIIKKIEDLGWQSVKEEEMTNEDYGVRVLLGGEKR